MITPQVSPLELFQKKLSLVDPGTAKRIADGQLQIVDYELYYNTTVAHGAQGIIKIIATEQVASIGITNLHNGKLLPNTYFLATHVGLVTAGEVLTANVDVATMVYAPFSYDSALANRIIGAFRNGEFKLKVENDLVCQMPAGSLFDQGRERMSADVDSNRGVIVPKFIASDRIIEATVELPQGKSLALAGGATYSLPFGIRIRGLATLPK
jgi:hypothetical protein